MDGCIFYRGPLVTYNTVQDGGLYGTESSHRRGNMTARAIATGAGSPVRLFGAAPGYAEGSLARWVRHMRKFEEEQRRKPGPIPPMGPVQSDMPSLRNPMACAAGGDKHALCVCGVMWPRPEPEGQDRLGLGRGHRIKVHDAEALSVVLIRHIKYLF